MGEGAVPAIERQTYSLSRALIEPLYIEPYSMSSNLENDQIETRSENLTSFLQKLKLTPADLPTQEVDSLRP